MHCCRAALQVGTISANGEREIGDLIARAMEKVRFYWVDSNLNLNLGQPGGGKQTAHWRHGEGER